LIQGGKEQKLYLSPFFAVVCAPSPHLPLRALSLSRSLALSISLFLILLPFSRFLFQVSPPRPLFSGFDEPSNLVLPDVVVLVPEWLKLQDYVVCPESSRPGKQGILHSTTIKEFYFRPVVDSHSVQMWLSRRYRCSCGCSFSFLDTASSVLPAHVQHILQLPILSSESLLVIFAAWSSNSLLALF
jgi:hypothetical protein